MRGTWMEKEVEIFCCKRNQQNQVQEHHCKEIVLHPVHKKIFISYFSQHNNL
jgi:hypothetical protein